MKTQKELEKELDKKSRPLRKVIIECCQKYHISMSSRFDTAEKVWNFDLFEVCVEVNEQGTEATIFSSGRPITVTTPNSLRIVLNRIFDYQKKAF